MTREKAIKILQGAIKKPNTKDGYLGQAIDMAIKALEQQPCEDAISRQAVLDINERHHGQMPNHVNHEIWKEINALPLITPQPKIGHWILVDDCEHFIAKCSECGRTEDSRLIYKYPYCHCGAKMVEPQERSE